jgi:oxygen-independent coproporphyrinogen-3 oxidase
MIARSPLDLLLKYDLQVPRYTSYPPAPHFNRSPEEIRALDLVDDSNLVGPWNASLYVHIPFCPKRCHFCGCHTEIGRPGSAVRDYMETLLLEADFLIPHIQSERPVTQIHFGGGTPNAAPFGAIKALLDRFRTRLSVEPDAEIAMECDPNLITADRIRELDRMGFTRLSFGIQDFDLRVLAAVNRRFPKTPPKELFRLCRELGMSGNNLDLIYGLPYQTPAGFRETIDKAIDADPDRISLFPYAHVPWIKGHQAVLDPLPMPGAATRLEMAWAAREALERAGYEAVGMDHFAKPSDELAAAAREGSLHRNFQGYCHGGRAGQVYAIGASAISQLHEGYLQNTKDLEDYQALVRMGRPAWKSGYRMRPVDIAVRAVLNGILCAGRADLQAAFDEAGVPAEWIHAYLSASLERLQPYLEDELVAVDGAEVRLLGHGRYVARMVAAAFDPMLEPASEAAAAPRYSRAL